jgi:hypothetical protein
MFKLNFKFNWRKLFMTRAERHRLEFFDWIRHAVPLVASILIACVYVAGMQLPIIMSVYRVTALFLLAALAVALVAMATWVLDESWRGAMPLALLVLGGFGFLMTVSSDAARYGLSLLVAALCFYDLSRLESGHDADRPVGREGRERLALILLAPAVLFAYTFAFAVLEFTSVGVGWMALPVGLMTAAVIGEMVWHAQRTGAYAWRLPAFAAVLGMEFFVTLSFLPLKHLVNGAVMAILLSLFAHKVRDALAPSAEPLAYRRHVALSILLIAVILVTAQWL